MLKFLRMIFTWWHNQTIGVAFYTWRRGELVGIDQQGNHYYQDKKGDSVNGKTRRWVVYNGDIEATRIAPEWHGWMHYTVDAPPADNDTSHEWQKPHKINLTGTKGAHKPAGLADSASAPAGYEAWHPKD